MILMSNDTSTEENSYKADPKLWIVFVVIACISAAIPLYVYFTKKYCPSKLPRGFQLRDEQEDWPQHHKGGMFGEKEESDQEETGGLKPISEEV